MPYMIPDDSTNARVTCQDSDPSANHLSFIQSSVVTKNFGIANCFFEDKSASPDFSQDIVCEGVGRLQKNSDLQVAF